MADWFYKLVHVLGWSAFHGTGRRLIVHRNRIPRQGAFILAPNHLSPYDVPCLIDMAPRVLDFVSITELFQNRLVAWFFSSMGAFPLNRARPNADAIRTVLERLDNGRAVVMFPEGQFRTAEASVIRGGNIRPGVARLAQRAGVPIIPCVIIGTGAYRRLLAWLPLRRTVYACIFGTPIEPGEQAEQAEKQLREAYPLLYKELLEALGPGRAARVRL
jgi:1-acyl-sn-glycerol-3-phosphate acyltransferase